MFDVFSAHCRLWWEHFCVLIRQGSSYGHQGFWQRYAECMYCSGYRVNSSLLSLSVLTSNDDCGYCAGSSGQEVGTY